MKAIYKCRVCGTKMEMDLFPLDEVDHAALQDGYSLIPDMNKEWRDNLTHYGTIFAKCDLNHYGLMDFVGYAMDKAVVERHNYHAVVRNDNLIYLLRESENTEITTIEHPFQPWQKVYKNCYIVAEYIDDTIIPRRCSQNSLVTVSSNKCFSGIIKNEHSFYDDSHAMAWFESWVKLTNSIQRGYGGES